MFSIALATNNHNSENSRPHLPSLTQINENVDFKMNTNTNRHFVITRNKFHLCFIFFFSISLKPRALRFQIHYQIRPLLGADLTYLITPWQYKKDASALTGRAKFRQILKWLLKSFFFFFYLFMCWAQPQQHKSIMRRVWNIETSNLVS